ncbi:MAG: hypothetical protein H6765_01320 [Candidatus Peribacteria bacterium]|nr:MAG: hypothetical protein H6765_01320 [Candidatus Peribacteria bacterium]
MYTEDLALIDQSKLVGSTRFGIPGQNLHFSKPVAVRMPADGPDNSRVRALVMHEGESYFGTAGITSRVNATCSAGQSSFDDNLFKITAGYVTVYTCGASAYILDPDGDTTDEAGLWLRADM